MTYRFPWINFLEGYSDRRTDTDEYCHSSQVVLSHSSKIGIARERLFTINGNHMEICRFADKDEGEGYRTAKGILERYGRTLEERVEERVGT